MSGSVEFQESRSGWKALPAKPLDEAVWQAWVEKGRARDRLTSAARVKTVKWVSIAVLLVTAAFWTSLTPYDVVVRFIVAGAALVVMFQLLHAKQYALAAVFGAVALLYNPMVPPFTFSGDWQRAMVVATALPFVASLVWRSTRTEHND